MLKDLIAREPALTAGAVVTALGAIIALLDAFGITHTTPEQRQAIAGAVVSVWPVVLVLRQLVTPSAAPSIKQGTTVTVVTPGDQPNTTTTV